MICSVKNCKNEVPDTKEHKETHGNYCKECSTNTRKRLGGNFRSVIHKNKSQNIARLKYEKNAY